MINKEQRLKWYLNAFQEYQTKLNGESKKPLNTFRKESFEILSKLNFPDKKEEAWRFTDISPILEHDFLPSFGSKEKLSKEDIYKSSFEFEEFNTVILQNGIYDAELSNILDKKQLDVRLISSAIEDKPELLKSVIGKISDESSNVFSNLNASFLSDGLFISVKKNTVVPHPLIILNVTSAGTELFSNPRTYISLEENSELSLIEDYESKTGSVYLTNLVTEIQVGKSARLNHIKIQNESDKAFHISKNSVLLSRESNYSLYNLDFGGKLVRNDIELKFTDEYAECHLNGLYLTEGNQLVDNHTMINHAAPNCRSNELFKGVLSGNSRAVFSGKVFVNKIAQKTNAFQSNKNILLSESAKVDAQPQLEIYADDVKCSHGATVGQIDEEALFYLRSRGIGKELALSSLIYAFADDFVNKIQHANVLEYVEQLIEKKLSDK